MKAKTNRNAKLSALPTRANCNIGVREPLRARRVCSYRKMVWHGRTAPLLVLNCLALLTACPLTVTGNLNNIEGAFKRLKENSHLKDLDDKLKHVRALPHEHGGQKSTSTDANAKAAPMHRAKPNYKWIKCSNLTDYTYHGLQKKGGYAACDAKNHSLVLVRNHTVRLGSYFSSIFNTVVKKKIAVAITITKDGPYIDGAAVLAESVLMMKSMHDVEMVAIVHSEVQETRPALLRLGYKIREFELPINSSEIKGKSVRERIDKTGCCGAQELLKLRAYQLSEYDRVVAMDMDTLIVQSFDKYFEYEEALFTYDYAMIRGTRPTAPLMQGGMLIIKPSETVYREIVAILLEGDFRSGTGWKGARIGWGWGGMTIQGIISYYYNIEAPPRSFFELDHCRVNAMTTTQDCKSTEWEEIESIHFTSCQKPFSCRGTKTGLCGRMTKAWWDVRRHLEARLGLEVTDSNIDACDGGPGRYPHIKW